MTTTAGSAMTEHPKHAEITRALADYLVALSWDDLDEAVIQQAKLFTLECLGHMLHAHPQPVSRIVVGLAREAGAKAEAVVVGGGFRTTAAEAAYVNGTLAHADELEAYGTLPGTGLVPPIAGALAVGELRRSGGRDLLTAIVAGIEMQGRLGAAGLGAPDRGFMGFSLVGPAGAGVAAAKLLGLDSWGLRNCLGVALPLSNGSLRGCGYMTHVHEAGVPARTGVHAAILAARGFTAAPDFLDGAHSWGEQFAAGGRGYHPEALTAGLGEEFFLLTSGASAKKYGSCGLTHLAIEGMIELLRDHAIAPDDIDTVDLEVPAFADRVAAFREPVDGDQAKFSIVHSVAGLLVEGVPELPYVRAFSDESARDPRYVAARRRVRLRVADGSLNVRSFQSQTVTVHLRDGRTLSTEVDPLRVRGREANPLTVDERLAMFRNTARSLGDEGTDRLVDLVLNLEQHDAVQLADLVVGSPG